MQQLVQSMPDSATTGGRHISIPVCYDLSLAPDIEFVASQHALTTQQVIALHTSTAYRVYMIGFQQGFPYMAAVDKQIATPRKSNPRTSVPAGSVGIAGDQTGIYPFTSPGGWQLIGQTPLQMFNKNNHQPTLLQPGDEVQFYPISLSAFHQLKPA